MTTEAAEKFYLITHLMQHAGRQVAIHNPHGMAVEDLPVIYGFNNGGPPGQLMAQLIAEDGTALGSHCCSAEGYMPHDLGILEDTKPARHEHFRQHYPDGYRMTFVSHDDPDLLVAVERHAKLQSQLEGRSDTVDQHGEEQA